MEKEAVVYRIDVASWSVMKLEVRLFHFEIVGIDKAGGVSSQSSMAVCECRFAHI